MRLEPLTFNPSVLGSNPRGPTTSKPTNLKPPQTFSFSHKLGGVDRTDLAYAPNQLDRDVVPEDQIRTVIQDSHTDHRPGIDGGCRVLRRPAGPSDSQSTVGATGGGPRCRSPRLRHGLLLRPLTSSTAHPGRREQVQQPARWARKAASPTLTQIYPSPRDAVDTPIGLAPFLFALAWSLWISLVRRRSCSDLRVSVRATGSAC